MMVLLAAFAGLRVHEIAKIHGKDFDPIAGTLRVEGKGRKKVTIPLHPAIRAEAVEYPRAELWFPGRMRKDQPVEPMTRHHVSQIIREAMDTAHVDATAHALRHTFATSLVNEDVDMLTIQKLMRHSSPTSTAIYAEVSRVRRAEAVNRLALPV
jgi:integrase/recombinase XerD